VGIVLKESHEVVKLESSRGRIDELESRLKKSLDTSFW